MKKIMIFLIILLATIFFAYSSLAQPLSEKNIMVLMSVQNQLASEKTVSGDFHQMRKLQLLTRPLISSGTFSLSKKNGLRWEQLMPFPSLLIVTKNTISQKIGDGPTTFLTQEQQPLVSAFTKIFLSIFSGDIKQVQQYFNVSFSGSPERWEMVLTPKTSPLNKALLSVHLSGKKTIQSISIEDAKKNSMMITLSKLKIG